MEWLENDLWGQRQQLEQELQKLLRGESFLESAKTLLGFGPVWVIEQLQVWLSDAVRVAYGESRGAGGLIERLAQAGARRLLGFYELLLRKKALLLSSANPNPQMLLDEIMMEMQDLYRKKD